MTQKPPKRPKNVLETYNMKEAGKVTSIEIPKRGVGNHGKRTAGVTVMEVGNKDG